MSRDSSSMDDLLVAFVINKSLSDNRCFPFSFCGTKSQGLDSHLIECRSTSYNDRITAPTIEGNGKLDKFLNCSRVPLNLYQKNCFIWTHFSKIILASIGSFEAAKQTSIHEANFIVDFILL